MPYQQGYNDGHSAAQHFMKTGERRPRSSFLGQMYKNRYAYGWECGVKDWRRKHSRP